jgi:hypothetical protein
VASLKRTYALHSGISPYLGSKMRATPRT